MSFNSVNEESGIKKLILDIGCRLWTKGFIASNDGNISVRISENELLITPTGVSKGFMTEEMIVRITMDGTVVGPETSYRPSSEYKLHVQVYQERNDVKSVVHAHPPYSTSFGVAGIPLDKCTLPEAIIMLGSVPIAPYGTPSTKELPDSIREHIQKSDAILLANHGALTVGIDLLTAYHRMETLEHTAKILHLAIGLGNVNVLSREYVEKLMELRSRMNIPGRITIAESSEIPTTRHDGKRTDGLQERS